jgi:hypothetical protein
MAANYNYEQNTWEDNLRPELLNTVLCTGKMHYKSVPASELLRKENRECFFLQSVLGMYAELWGESPPQVGSFLSYSRT